MPARSRVCAVRTWVPSDAAKFLLHRPRDRRLCPRPSKIRPSATTLRVVKRHPELDPCRPTRAKLAKAGICVGWSVIDAAPPHAANEQLGNFNAKLRRRCAAIGEQRSVMLADCLHP